MFTSSYIPSRKEENKTKKVLLKNYERKTK